VRGGEDNGGEGGDFVGREDGRPGGGKRGGSRANREVGRGGRWGSVGWESGRGEGEGGRAEISGVGKVYWGGGVGSENQS